MTKGMEKSLRDKIYEKTRDDITWGRLAPGERLVEDRLAEEFKASRSPVREALRLLEAEGLITFERNRGITVAKLSIKQVEEIYVMRWLLEGYAARVTGSNIAPKGIARLVDLNEKLQVAGKQRALKEWFNYNSLFHNYFYEQCGNSNLIKVVDNLKRKVSRYDYVSMSVPWNFETSLEHHEGMIEGCKKNDGEMVEKFMKLHLESNKETLINHLKNQGILT
jgi:DNA-binding GntR family transcriptional regulator